MSVQEHKHIKPWYIHLSHNSGRPQGQGRSGKAPQVGEQSSEGT